MNAIWSYVRLGIIILAQFVWVRYSLLAVGEEGFGEWILGISFVGIFVFINQALSRSVETLLAQNASLLFLSFKKTVSVSIFSCLAQMIIASLFYNKSVIYVLVLAQFFSNITIVFRSFYVARGNFSRLTFSIFLEYGIRTLFIILFYFQIGTVLHLTILYLIPITISLVFEIITNIRLLRNINIVHSQKLQIKYFGHNAIGPISYSLYSSGLNLVLHNFLGNYVLGIKGVLDKIQQALEQLIGVFQFMVMRFISSAKNEDNFEPMVFSLQIFFILSSSIFLLLFDNSRFIVKIWLDNDDLRIEKLVNLILVFLILNSLEYPISQIVRAAHRVAKYQLIVSPVTLLVLPVTYVFFLVNEDFGLASVYIVLIAIYSIALVTRFYFLLSDLKMPLELLKSILKWILFKVILLSLAVILFSKYPHWQLHFRIGLLIYLLSESYYNEGLRKFVYSTLRG